MTNTLNNLVQDILNKLKVLGFYKGDLDEATIVIWVDALAGLTEEHLIAGFDFYKKNGNSIKAAFNSAQFRTICKEAYTPRPEFQALKLEAYTGEAITAKEFINRVKSGQYKPSGYLANGEPVTRQAVLKGLSYLGKSNYLDLLADLKSLKKEEDAYNNLSEDEQAAKLEEIRIIWQKQAETVAEIEELGKCSLD